MKINTLFDWFTVVQLWRCGHSVKHFFIDIVWSFCYLTHGDMLLYFEWFSQTFVWTGCVNNIYDVNYLLMNWYDFRSSNRVNVKMCVCQNIQYCTNSINKHTQLGCNLIKCNKIQRMTNAPTATTKYNVQYWTTRYMTTTWRVKAKNFLQK